MNYTLSDNAVKLSKSKAFNLLKDKAINGEQLSKIEIDSLLLHFAPAQPKKVKSDIDWLAIAAGKKDIRHYLNSIRLMENGDQVATDGHRMHLIKTNIAINEQRAIDIKTKLDIDIDIAGRYPNYERAIPCKNLVESEEGLTISTKYGYAIEMKVNNIVKHYVNFKYYNEAISYMSNPVIYVNDYSIKIEDGNKIAVIMPMSID